MGLPTPRYQYAPSGNFFKKSFQIKTPRCWDPWRKISKDKIRPGPALSLRQSKQFPGPPALSFLGPPLCRPWRGCGGPQRRRFIFPGERSWGGFHGAGAPGGRGRAGRGRRQPGPISSRLLLPVSALFARFRYTNDRDKFAEGRIVARSSLFQVGRLPSSINLREEGPRVSYNARR